MFRTIQDVSKLFGQASGVRSARKNKGNKFTSVYVHKYFVFEVQPKTC